MTGRGSDETVLEPELQVTPNVRLVSELGSGGMGTVWRGREDRFDRDVAVKFLDRELMEKNPAMAARFRGEGKATAKIKSPHVVEIYDRGKLSDGTPFLVMELLEGESLSAHLRRRSKLPVEEASSILHQVSLALTAAHRIGVIHRDVKPANIFLTAMDDEPFVKVLDFGIAKHTPVSKEAHRLTKTGAVMGTPAYMSPEQVRDPKRVTHQTDLWALAVVAYEMITGERTFRGRTAGAVVVAAVQRDYEPPSEHGADKAFDAWFERAFDERLDGRFHNAHELADTFDALCTEGRKQHLPRTSLPSWDDVTPDENLPKAADDVEPEANETAKMRVAIAGASPSGGAMLTLKELCTELAGELETTTSGHLMVSYDDLVRGVENDEFHLMWLPPLVARTVIASGSATGLVVPVRAGTSGYVTVLFTRDDSPIERVDQLVGTRIGWVDVNSMAGYALPRAMLRERGLNVDDLFEEQQFFGSHEAVVAAVLSGKVDVGATHARIQREDGIQVVSKALEGKPARILAHHGPVPADLVAVGRGVDAATCDRLRRILMANPDAKLTQIARRLLECERFELIEPSHLRVLGEIADSTSPST